MRYRVTRSKLIVTKPDGMCVQRDILLYYDTVTSTFGLRVTGDSPLKGYTFDLIQSELKRTRDSGTPMNDVPRE